mmetsp:Transcript_66/g.120  ORF Transcript_66/g.120 Transcript_66/m.120 type:complete len:128 (-) Transcript_66:197-580(-)|eukprot:CAMPEP_0196807108 /NCGR_PEP_ID=MMETSP1362-20130617/7050_1 /TAXON_ID=163516 /ORGANISM="Leptocylindrus danicus, Strain CCMP1856" /LENGTH=127 /DNA_ID=CAMNT_0042180873 /DNA_START=50 /DNA_END=433 /DNA_ORIENTATION=+
MANRGLSAYRRLFRARQQLFQGDALALVKSREELRNEFIKNKFVTNPEELKEIFLGVDEVEDMMLHGIMQGKVNEQTNTVEVKIKPEHTVAMDAEEARNEREKVACASQDENKIDGAVLVEVTKSKG